jgi:3-oxoacyl-[acyl-carrier protein] reductase
MGANNMAKVVITGGNKGIGLEITKLFLQAGDDIIVVARDLKDFELKNNNKISAISFDLQNIEAIPDLIKEIGEIDILINNAGSATGLAPENYDTVHRTYIENLNLAAPIALITGFLPGLIRNGRGRVVNTASQAGVFGHYDIWYGATKAGLINATKTFASLYGSKGLVINSVSPGPVKIDRILNSPNKERYERIISRTILKRYALPEEVAKVVYWLAKESPEYLNGENYLINNNVTSLDA